MENRIKPQRVWLLASALNLEEDFFHVGSIVRLLSRDMSAFMKILRGGPHAPYHAQPSKL